MCPAAVAVQARVTWTAGFRLCKQDNMDTHMSIFHQIFLGKLNDSSVQIVQLISFGSFVRPSLCVSFMSFPNPWTSIFVFITLEYCLW